MKARTSFTLFLGFCILAWTFACLRPEVSTVYIDLYAEEIYDPNPKPATALKMDTTEDTPDFIPEQLFAIDSCDLNFINSPIFRGYGSWYREAVPDRVEVVFGQVRETWIEDAAEVVALIPLIRDVLLSNQLTFSDLIVLDGAGIEQGIMVLDFNMYFINPSGQFEFTSGRPAANRKLHLEWNNGTQGVKYYPMLQSEGSLLIGTNGTSSVVTQVIEMLPSWQKFSVYGSAMTDAIWNALLADCKAGVFIDARNQTIDQEFLDQAEYQQITVLQ